MFSSNCNVLPKNEYDHTDRDNPVLINPAAFKYYYLCQDSYNNPQNIIAVVPDDSAFDDWYNAADNSVKNQINVLYELLAGWYMNDWIQICGPADPERTNIQIITSFIESLQNG